MNTIQPQSNKPVGIQKAPHPAKESDAVLSAILRGVLETREVRQLLIMVVPAFLNVWAGESWWKKTLSKAAGSSVDRQLSRPDDVLEKNEIAALFDNEAFINHLALQLPGIVNGIFDALAVGIRSIEGLPAEEKKRLFEDVLIHTGQGRSGEMLTRCARMLVDIHTVDPEFMAHTLSPGINKWLESMDFAEIKEALEDSQQGALALVRIVNDAVWQYPSKVIGIFSLLPSIANMAAGATEITLGKLNGLSPDLLTDVIISLLREIDGKAVAGLVNEVNEIGRKVHTGSALLGEPGSPQMPKVLAQKLEEVVSETDPTVFWKSRIGLAEIKAAFDEALSNALAQHPDFLRLGMSRVPELTNIRLRTRNRIVSRLGSLDDTELSDLLSLSLSTLDVQEVAELINNYLRLANRLYEVKPEICTEIVNQFVNAVDPFEIGEAIKLAFAEMRDELRPIARSVVPGVVEWVCDVLQPEEDEYEDNAARAREALRTLLLAEEV